MTKTELIKWGGRTVADLVINCPLSKKDILGVPCDLDDYLCNINNDYCIDTAMAGHCPVLKTYYQYQESR